MLVNVTAKKSWSLGSLGLSLAFIVHGEQKLRSSFQMEAEVFLVEVVLAFVKSEIYSQQNIFFMWAWKSLQLVPVTLFSQTYFWLDTTRFWQDSNY